MRIKKMRDRWRWTSPPGSLENGENWCIQSFHTTKRTKNRLRWASTPRTARDPVQVHTSSARREPRAMDEAKEASGNATTDAVVTPTVKLSQVINSCTKLDPPGSICPNASHPGMISLVYRGRRFAPGVAHVPGQRLAAAWAPAPAWWQGPCDDRHLAPEIMSALE